MGTIEGWVQLQAGSELPSYPPGTVPDPGSTLPDLCGPPRTSFRQPVKKTKDGHLAGILVSATGFQTVPPHPAVTHRVVIENCRLTPALVVATQHDTLVVGNETDHAFVPSLVASPLMQVVLQGQEYSIPLDQPTTTELGCHFSTPCGKTHVFVLSHPVHATTSSTGYFRIEHVPTGKDIKLHAWHPLFEETMQPAPVEENATTHITLSLAPRTE